MCILCFQGSKIIKGRNQQLHLCQKETMKVLKITKVLKSYAIEGENIDLLHKVNYCESQNKEVRYCNCCKKDLVNRIQSKTSGKHKRKERNRKRNIPKNVFEVNIADLGQCSSL